LGATPLLFLQRVFKVGQRQAHLSQEAADTTTIIPKGEGSKTELMD